MSTYNINYEKIAAYTRDKVLDKTFYDHLHKLGIVITLGTMEDLDMQAGIYGDSLYPHCKSISIDRFATDGPFHMWKSFRAMKNK